MRDTGDAPKQSVSEAPLVVAYDTGDFNWIDHGTSLAVQTSVGFHCRDQRGSGSRTRVTRAAITETPVGVSRKAERPYGRDIDLSTGSRPVGREV